MKISLSLPDADSYGKETLTKIRKNLGSDRVVLGSYLALGTGDVRLDLKLEDATSGEIVDSLTENGKEQQVSDLVSRCGSSLREKLGAGEVSATEATAVKATLPSNPKAGRLYSEGLAKLRVYDSLAARDLLQKAVAAEPSFALAHSALASAWSGLGYDQKAKDEARKAFDLSKDLSDEDRLLIEGRFHSMMHDEEKAVQIYQTLWKEHRDNLDYGLRLAGEQLYDKPKEALVTVEELRGLPLPASDDPRVDFTEAAAGYALGDFKRMQVAAERGVQKAQTAGARLLVAQGRNQVCGALHNLGEFRTAIASCEEARKIYIAAGDIAAAAGSLSEIGDILGDQGDFAGALRASEEASAVYRKVGNKTGEANRLNSVSGVLSSRGELRAAEKIFQRAIAIDEEVGDKYGVATSLGNLAGDIVQHDPVEAGAPAQKSLIVAEQIGDKVNQQIALYILGMIHYFLGDLSNSKQKYEEALRLTQETKTPIFGAWVLKLQGDLLTAQGSIGEARQKYEEALKVQNQTGQKNYGAQTQLSLDALLIDAGDFSPAERGSREALQEFQKDGDADDAVWARAVLAQTLLGEQKLGEAEKQIQEGAPAAAQDENRVNRFHFNISASQVYAAAGRTSEAEKKLEVTLVEAQQYGFVPYQYEARLALGKIEIKSGKATAGRARLEALEKDATAKGFLLIARKAAAALK